MLLWHRNGPFLSKNEAAPFPDIITCHVVSLCFQPEGEMRGVFSWLQSAPTLLKATTNLQTALFLTDGWGQYGVVVSPVHWVSPVSHRPVFFFLHSSYSLDVGCRWKVSLLPSYPRWQLAGGCLFWLKGLCPLSQASGTNIDLQQLFLSIAVHTTGGTLELFLSRLQWKYNLQRINNTAGGYIWSCTEEAFTDCFSFIDFVTWHEAIQKPELFPSCFISQVIFYHSYKHTLGYRRHTIKMFKPGT